MQRGSLRKPIGFEIAPKIFETSLCEEGGIDINMPLRVQLGGICGTT